ncbi:MAG: hypothetical protein HQL22_10050 [Candidatus Omnitrophica bacterium]|nr:hypothetical protein [Candidatus Omnitrophota bacterium]
MARKNNSNIEFETAFYEKVLEYAPDFIEALICLGDHYTRQGFYEKGLRVDEKLARLRPDDAVVMYNLACSYSLMNDIPLARGAMVKAFELGYDEWDHLRKDADLANLLRDSEFQLCMSEYRMKGARHRAQACGTYQQEAA